MGLAGLKSRLDGDCPEAPGELLVPCGRILGLEVPPSHGAREVPLGLCALAPLAPLPS